jgi:hypothetical protein
MTLLRDIQNVAIDSEADLLSLLRKCKVLATRLKNAEFSQWVDWELNGYKDVNLLPDYRVLQVFSKGHFSGIAGSGLRNADIPLNCIDQKFRDGLSKSRCMQPISAYLDLIRNPDSGNFQEPWPPNVVAIVGAKIYQYLNCMTAWKEIPRPAIVSLVEAVRNRILNFVLEIEVEAPDAGEAPSNRPSLSEEQVTQIFHNHIYGTVGNIAQGSQNVSQTCEMTVNENDIDSLKSFFESIGIPNDNIVELEQAINDDPVEEVKETKKLGSYVSGWLGATVSGIAQGVIPVLENVNASLITQAILRYYGIN